jgi:hypothetical protein
MPYLSNLNRSKVANALLHQLAQEKGIDIVLISEQYSSYDSTDWYSDLTATAAIWVVNPREVQVMRHGLGNGFVWIECNDNTFFSCYLTPNESINKFRDQQNSLKDAIRRKPDCGRRL